MNPIAGPSAKNAISLQPPRRESKLTSKVSTELEVENDSN
jgi:hypothetical protein